MNRIKRIATASAVGAAVLVPATGAALAIAKPDPGGPPPQTSTVSKPQGHAEQDQTSTSNADSKVPWEAIGVATVAGAAVTAGTVLVVRHTRQGTKPANA